MRFVAVLLVLSAATGSAAQFDTLFQQAKNFYYQGAYGDKSAASKGNKLFSKLYKEAPQDARVKAYYGSERLLEAAHTWAPWKKYSLSKQGIQLLDSAVERSPNNLEVRFVRAVTTYNLPGFFGRKKQSEQDFSYLSSRVVGAARDGKLEPSIAASALLFYGRICKEKSKPEQASVAWKSAENLAPRSKAGRDSASELARLRG